MPQTERALHSLLHHALRSCASTCCETLDGYDGLSPSVPGFATELMAVIAAVETALEAEPAKRRSALAVAAHVASEGAERLHRYGFGADILRCAVACDRAAKLCQIELGANV
jgi:hypothetical protein